MGAEGMIPVSHKLLAYFILILGLCIIATLKGNRELTGRTHSGWGQSFGTLCGYCGMHAIHDGFDGMLKHDYKLTDRVWFCD